MSNIYKIIEIGSSCLQTDPCQHDCVCESLDGKQEKRLLTGNQIVEFGRDLIIKNQEWMRHCAYLVDRLKSEKPVVTSPSETFFIAHRGNLRGPDPTTENHPEQIDRVLQMGYDCEIDLRRTEGQLWLGHDAEQYCITSDWLLKRATKLWIHCKNRAALEYCLANRTLHCFWHQSDDYTLTSHGFIWAYPGQPGGRSTVAVMPETRSPPHALCEYYAVCSDYADIIAMSDEPKRRSPPETAPNTHLVLGDKVLVESRQQIGEILMFILTPGEDKTVLVEFSNGQVVRFPETELQKIWSTTAIPS